MIHFKIFQDLSDDLLKDLAKTKNNSLLYIFQLPKWQEVILHNYDKSTRIRIVVIYERNEIILVAPLCIYNICGCKELGWITSNIIDYNNPIMCKSFDFHIQDFQNLWKEIIEDLSKQCDLIYFYKIPEFIEYKRNPLINLHYKYYQKSYQINLNNYDYDFFYNQNNNNKSKQTDRRKKKKLYEKNDLEYFYIDINLENFYLVEELINEKVIFYRKKKIKTFNNKILINQYRRLVIEMNKDYKFNISVIKKDGKKISSILGVIFNEIYYYLIPLTHETEFKKYSPGRFHIINLIKWAKNNKIKIIDFTAGDEIYKKNFSNYNFNIFYYTKLISFKGMPRFVFLNLYYKFRNNFFLKKMQQLIKYAI